MARRAALQRYTQHSSRGNDKEDLKRAGGGGGESCVFVGLETDHFFMGRLPASALEYDRTLKGDLPFLNCVCVEESTKELIYLFLETSARQFFRGDSVLPAPSWALSKCSNTFLKQALTPAASSVQFPFTVQTVRLRNPCFHLTQVQSVSY